MKVNILDAHDRKEHFIKDQQDIINQVIKFIDNNDNS